jgi:hypothetical protein
LRRVSGFSVEFCTHSGTFLLKYFCTKKKFFIKQLKIINILIVAQIFFSVKRKINLYKNSLDKLLFYKNIDFQKFFPSKNPSFEG